MGLLDWLKRRQAGDQKAVAQPAESAGETMLSLDVKAALDAHAAWRTRLEAVLKGTSKEDLEVGVIAADNNCVLGKWIYGAAKDKLANLAEYEELRQSHAKFHLCAGNILVEHRANNPDAAARLLKTEFRTMSDRVQLDLVRLYSEADKLGHTGRRGS